MFKDWCVPTRIILLSFCTESTSVQKSCPQRFWIVSCCDVHSNGLQVANCSSKPMNVDSQNFVGIPSQRLELVKELPFLKNCSLLKRCFESIQNHLNPIRLVHLIDRKMLKFLFGIAGQRTIEQQSLVALRSIGLHLNLPDANFLLIFCIGPKVILVILPRRWLWVLTRPPTDSRLRTFPWVPVCIIVLFQLSKCCNQRIAATSFPRGKCWSSSWWGFKATTWMWTSLSCRMMSNWWTYLGTKTLRGVISLGCCNARLNRWIMCQNFFLGLFTAFHVWRLTTTRLSSSSIPSSGRLFVDDEGDGAASCPCGMYSQVPVSVTRRERSHGR